MAGLRLWAAALVARVRQLLDRVPGVNGALDEIARVEVIDRTLVIAGQALLAAVPLLVVLSAFTARSVESSVLSEVSSVMGLSGSALGPVRKVLAPSDEIRTETGLVGLVIAVLSAISFARAVQRTFDRVWQMPTSLGDRPETAVGRIRRCLIWMAGWVGYLQALALLARIGVPGPVQPFWTVLVQGPLAIAVWWWTPWLLLGGRVPWRSLLPGAVLTAFGLLALTRVSQVVMPSYAGAQVDQYGPLGVVFAAATWFVAFGGIVVAAALLGRLLVTDDQLAPFARLLRLREPATHRPAAEGPPAPGPAEGQR